MRAAGTGSSSREPLASIPHGTLLPPAATWLAALEGTAGRGIRRRHVRDCRSTSRGPGCGSRMPMGSASTASGHSTSTRWTAASTRQAPARPGLTLPVFAVDRLRGESYQRAAQTGDNMEDFARRPRPAPARSTHRRPNRWRRAHSPCLMLSASNRASPRRHLYPASQPPRGRMPRSLRRIRGRSSEGALQTRVGDSERTITHLFAASLSASDDGYDFPYVRFSVPVDGPATVRWSGELLGRSELRLVGVE